jgi:aryl-alcohol dehydrogenase-like predicted oxidoreductase
MEYRTLGRTGYEVSAVSFGAWAIGGTWGTVRDSESMAALHRAVELGVNFFDTADVYGDGRSERLLARLCKECKREIFIATKAGRRLDPHVPEGYTRENLASFVERSLRNLDAEALDLLQLHCPPTAVYYTPEVFEALDDLVKEGKVRHYGVSVEKVEEALKAIDYPGVETIQIVYNMFRQRPAERLLEAAKERQVGVIARVPLASGLLTGKFAADARFEADDHRSFNRSGEAFDRGETFAGVDFETGLRAVEALRAVRPPGMTLAQFALRWILSSDAVSCAIPGGKRAEQVEENVAAADLPELSDDTLTAVRGIYERLIRDQVHHRW